MLTQTTRPEFKHGEDTRGSLDSGVLVPIIRVLPGREQGRLRWDDMKKHGTRWTREGNNLSKKLNCVPAYMTHR